MLVEPQPLSFTFTDSVPFRSKLENFVGKELASVYVVGPFGKEENAGQSYRNISFLQMTIDFIFDIINNGQLNGALVKPSDILYIAPYRGKL